MAITNLDGLVTALDNWLVKSYATSRAYEFIALAEAHLNRELRIRDMETTADLTITEDTREVALPTRFLGSRRLYVNTSPVRNLEYMVPEDYWSRWLATRTGPPEAYTIEGDNIVLGPIPDTGYTGKILYWQGFEALNAEGGPETNDLLTNHPDAYLAASLFWAFTFKDDDKNIQKWANILREIITSMHESNEKDRYPAGDLVQRTDVGNPPQVRR